METRVKFVLSCCMFLFMAPLFAAATRQSATSSEIEAERYLARVNKPFVKSIESPDGDIIDCVLIADQPAFDNHLLKNHTIQMRPSYYPEEASKNVTRAKAKFQMWHLTGSCPKGTIPIRRTRKEDVLRASSIERYGQKTLDSTDITQTVSYTHEHAVAEEMGGKYFGGKGFFNIWQPYVERPIEFSLAQVWVIARDAYTANTIEAGWQVFRRMYDDSRPRFFIYYTNNNYQANSGCYNLHCSGFLQISNKITIGGAISRVSSYMGEQFSLPIEIWKDPFTNNWWLKVNHVNVGYWPASLLPILSGGATEIHWGGEVVNVNPDGRHTSTRMGSGYFPEKGFRKASYVRNLEVMHADGMWGPPRNLKDFATWPGCYNVNLKYGVKWGTFFYYGGPGLNIECP